MILERRRYKGPGKIGRDVEMINLYIIHACILHTLDMYTMCRRRIKLGVYLGSWFSRFQSVTR